MTSPSVCLSWPSTAFTPSSPVAAPAMTIDSSVPWTFFSTEPGGRTAYCGLPTDMSRYLSPRSPIVRMVTKESWRILIHVFLLDLKLYDYLLIIGVCREQMSSTFPTSIPASRTLLPTFSPKEFSRRTKSV